MKKSTPLLTILLTMSLLTYSQEILKSTETTKTVTDYRVSGTGINTVNHIYADLKACNELADSLESEIKTAKLIIKDRQRYSDQADDQIANLTAQYQEQKNISDLKEKELKKAKRKNKLSKVLGYIGIPAGFLGGILAGVYAGGS